MPISEKELDFDSALLIPSLLAALPFVIFVTFTLTMVSVH